MTPAQKAMIDAVFFGVPWAIGAVFGASRDWIVKGCSVAALLALNEWASERRWERVCLIERIRQAKWRRA